MMANVAHVNQVEIHPRWRNSKILVFAKKKSIIIIGRLRQFVASGGLYRQVCCVTMVAVETSPPAVAAVRVSLFGKTK
jgi:hypothetical protein